MKPNRSDIAVLAAPNNPGIDTNIAGQATYGADTHIAGQAHIAASGKVRPGISTRISGQQFGSLRLAYSADSGRRIVCYCFCSAKYKPPSMI